MKRFFVFCLAVVMLLGCTALADGALYQGEITFQGASFGVTSAEVDAAWKKAYPKSSGFLLPLSSYTTRDMVDDWTVEYGLRVREELTGKDLCVAAMYGSLNGVYNKVAGYDASQVTMYCVYAVENGQLVEDKQKAKFYAAKYTFNPDEVAVSEPMYFDLLEKLTGIYGEPYAQADHVDMIWGAPDVSNMKEWFGIEETAEAYNAFKKESFGIDETYVVWKSAVNDAYLILKRENESADKIRMIEIFYIDPQGDQWLAEAYAAQTGDSTYIDTTGSTKGL